MLIRWLQQVLFGPLPNAGALGQGEQEGRAARAEGKLLDVVREALKEEAEELTELVANGVPAIRRRRMRRRVHRRVSQVIDSTWDAPEVVDEVTERLANVAEVDPYYARLFAEEK
ncbi:MAG: hypothetical protein HYV03_00575 [Deltaproteobacteria bacterium]|nr:hypothetical protein [Deltaproteobacteria bacterium]